MMKSTVVGCSIESDVLSTFDYVVVDYDDRRLGLPPA
jgi:hypothetical protein